MRESVTKHLESNSVFYGDFLAQPVRGSNGDTEAPDDDAALIDAVTDQE